MHKETFGPTDDRPCGDCGAVHPEPHAVDCANNTATAATTTAATTIDIGAVAAKELVFTAGRDDRRYILQAPAAVDDYLAFITRFKQYDVKRTSHYYIDDTEGQWFACYNVDCFDPPFAVVRASTFEQAYEVFCDEFENWIKVDDVDAVDYPENERNYNGNGTHIDTDNVQIHELTLVSVSL